MESQDSEQPHTCDRRAHSWPIIHHAPWSPKDPIKRAVTSPTKPLRLPEQVGGGGSRRRSQTREAFRWLSDSGWTDRRHSSLSHCFPWWPGTQRSLSHTPPLGVREDLAKRQELQTEVGHSTLWSAKRPQQNQLLEREKILRRIKERKVRYIFLFFGVKAILSQLTQCSQYCRYI